MGKKNPEASVMYSIVAAAMFSTAAGKALWSSQPAVTSDFIRTAYVLGNGKLGAMPLGAAGSDYVNLNVDSLWTGGPFENSSYTGGNPSSSIVPLVRQLQATIFKQGYGDYTDIMGSVNNYGSYEVLGNLTINVAGISSPTSYRRSLDLASGVHTVTYVANGASFSQTTFCSYPDQVCVYQLNSTAALPQTTVGLENQLRTSPAGSLSCSGNTLVFRGLSYPDLGMTYDARAQLVIPNHQGTNFCDSSTGKLVIPSSTATSLQILIAADTSFDDTKGNAANSFSFRGVDPAAKVSSTVSAAAKKSFSSLLSAHVDDFTSYSGRFTLNLPDTMGSSNKETSALISGYSVDNGDPYVESLLFDLGRYLFMSSARSNSLPAGLQGRWTEQLSPSWGADFHADVNLQMNHWSVDQTGLGDLKAAAFNYMTQNWMPRGAETAQLVYGADAGWVTHDEMNLFGHTGIKNWYDAALYPIAGAWMMQHVWDYFDYTQDAEWYQKVGYPLLKGVVQFWLSTLVEDEYFKDGTLVSNPCYSAEHGNATFGCSQYQQLIWEMFDHIEAGWSASGDTDQAFLTSVKNASSYVDKGIHIGSWGQLQEWKIDEDVKNDTHRHLSGLYGWFPGYMIANTFNNETVVEAVTTMLWSRGVGIIDSDAGWEKVWRSACWGRLNNTDQAYYELRLTVNHNIAGNALSMYSGPSASPPFQIDANFGWTAGVMEMLVHDFGRSAAQTASPSSIQVVILGPAIPTQWGSGSVSGLRIRGGGVVNFSWDESGTVTSAQLSGRNTRIPVHIVDKNGKILASH